VSARERSTARDDARLSDLAGIAAEARRALAEASPLASADAIVPARAGLYAIYGERDAWRKLGLGMPPDGRPLYIGKAEDSLVSRDLKTHFGHGRTGQSTLRRSFAALLHDELGLRGVPRNTAKPGYYPNYGLWPRGPGAEPPRRYVELIKRVGRARLESGDARGSLQVAERGLGVDALDEDTWRLALEAEGELGLREALEARYGRLQEILDARLGLEPAKETRALYLRLLSQS
jgi:transcriptional activator/GIY-YIG catalytic domain-containing protein